MDKIVIEGGRRLAGTVTASGSKNAALPILVSALLTDGPCIYDNVPDLRDIHSICMLLEHLGATVHMADHRVTVDPQGFANPEAPYDLVRKMRASILVLGPILARLGRARVSLPGGCAIGARPINFHLKALARMGASIELSHGYVEASCDRLRGADITFDMPTVGGTENLMMAAAMAEGRTVLRNAAREPEIVALADALKAMGASIQGAGTAVITVDGVETLIPASQTIIPDRIETGTYMVAAAVTRGDVRIDHCRPDHLEAVIDKLRLTGTGVEIGPDTIRVVGTETIRGVDIKTQPYPGFPTDMQAQFMVLMAVAGGSSIISETIFENRFIHVSELRRMGADIVVSGNTAVVKGNERLSAAPVMASDLRASASLVLAGLVAEGTTVVNRVYHLDRGYEHLDRKLADLGARIRREAGDDAAVPAGEASG
jgi:UDP-N-acetylglucosamine 1-carboxyvinyltransferase